MRKPTINTIYPNRNLLDTLGSAFFKKAAQCFSCFWLSGWGHAVLEIVGDGVDCEAEGLFEEFIGGCGDYGGLVRLWLNV